MLNGHGEGEKALPQSKPKRRGRDPLSTLAGLRQRACRIFRKVEAGKLSHEIGRSLIWQLAQIRPMLEAESLERIEARLEQLANPTRSRGLELHGHESAVRPLITAH